MDDGLKQRLIGAVVLVAAAIIFLPILFDDAGNTPEDIKVDIPRKPDVPKLEFSKPQAPSEKFPGVIEPSSRAESSVAGGEESGETPDSKQDSAKATESTGWTVQLGSFEELSNAEALRDKLRATGYKAYIKYRPDRTPALIQVFVGPELKRSAIDKLQGRLKTEFKLKGIVVPYVP